MTVLCKLEHDGMSYMPELVTYTTEVRKDGTTTKDYTRFLNREGLLYMHLKSETRPGSTTTAYQLTIFNDSKEPARFTRCGVTLGLASHDMTVDYFTSDWGSEFSPFRKEIDCKFSYGSESGRSTKGFTNWAGLQADDVYYTFALAWSGNWLFEIEPGDDGVFYASMELMPNEFAVTLKPGDRFTTPFLYVSKGQTMDEACLETRRYFAHNLSIIDKERFNPMPLEFNSWWPHEDKYINEDVFIANAKIAKNLGMSYAMMDAGWFGLNENGQTWYEKRGDWEIVNSKDFPSGMKALMDNTKALGIAPGMWCEIEAVGKYAKLNELKPNIIARRNGNSLGYVCFGSKEGYDWAMGVVDRILGEYGAKWIKFDFNLDPGFGCNDSEHDHGDGDGLYAHYIGYYRFLKEIHEKYPDVVLENCSSGGLRLDIGMMSHTHWTHLSDPDSTEFHLQCFWGALSYLHQSACLHFSWSEILGDHNLGISNPISEDMPRHKFDYIMRAVLTGVPGFSYSLLRFPQWCLDRLAELGKFYMEISGDFILNGDAHRLTPQPLSGKKGERFPVFQFNSADGRAIVFAYRLLDSPQTQTVRLRGLDPSRIFIVKFEDSQTEYSATGAELMSKGITFVGLPQEASEVARVY